MVKWLILSAVNVANNAYSARNAFLDSYISLHLLSLPAKPFLQFMPYKILQNEREPDIMLSKIVIHLATQYHP